MELLIFVEIDTPVDREQSRDLVLVVTIFKVFELMQLLLSHSYFLMCREKNLSISESASEVLLLSSR